MKQRGVFKHQFMKVWYLSLKNFVEGGRIDAMENCPETFKKLFFLSTHLTHVMAGKKLDRRVVMCLLRRGLGIVIAKHASALMKELSNNSDFFGIVTKGDLRPVDRRNAGINLQARRVACLELVEHVL